MCDCQDKTYLTKDSFTKYPLRETTDVAFNTFLPNPMPEYVEPSTQVVQSTLPAPTGSEENIIIKLFKNVNTWIIIFFTAIAIAIYQLFKTN